MKIPPSFISDFQTDNPCQYFNLVNVSRHQIFSIPIEDIAKPMSRSHLFMKENLLAFDNVLLSEVNI